MKKSPCNNCPFKKNSLKGWLGKDRSIEIASHVLKEDKIFQCHKTIGQEFTDPKNFCSGSIILDAKVNSQSLDKPKFANMNYRVLNMFGKLELKRVNEVFDNEKDFINHHTK